MRFNGCECGGALRRVGQWRATEVHPQHRQHRDGCQRPRGPRPREFAGADYLMSRPDRHRRDELDTDLTSTLGGAAGDAPRRHRDGHRPQRGRPTTSSGAERRHRSAGSRRCEHRQRRGCQRPLAVQPPAAGRRDRAALRRRDQAHGRRRPRQRHAPRLAGSRHDPRRRRRRLVSVAAATTLALMGVNDDVFQWDPGDGSDTLEGQAGATRCRSRSEHLREHRRFANGGRIRLFRDVANITMDLDDVEVIDFRGLAGADNVISRTSRTDRGDRPRPGRPGRRRRRRSRHGHRQRHPGQRLLRGGRQRSGIDVRGLHDRGGLGAGGRQRPVGAQRTGRRDAVDACR